MFTRLLTVVALAATVLVPAAQTATPAGPIGLQGFLLRTEEPFTDSFARTPSFAWASYDTARSYDFELATNKTFNDSTIVWSTASRAKPLQVPALALPVALPWITGSPYALYAHVRARTASGLTRWSAPFGFNMRQAKLPEIVVPEIPGLVRWKPIQGATSYEVWFVDAGKVITTTTNAADEREYYSFHPDSTWAGTVQWRVRAVRKIYGTPPNGLPAATVGPWSPTFVSGNPAVTSGALTLGQTVSDAESTASVPAAHGLTPAFTFSGNTATNGVSGRLFRVYVSTDQQCLNLIFKGAVVGSPAYAPRTSGPLALPTTSATVTAAQTAYLADGTQTGTFTADFSTVATSEQDASASTTTLTTTPTTTTTTATNTIPATFGATGALVDLFDSGWPTGHYYWTVVPVREVVSNGTVQYYDAEVPQDACAAGRVVAFGKASQPATTSAGKPYASGLNLLGNLVTALSATPSFYRAALIAWAPALGATGYEVQWSRTKNPWKPASAAPVYTATTSMLLEGLAPGIWYYRVRAIDPYVPGAIKQMTWSAPAQFKLLKPTFFVQSGVTTKRVK